MTSITAVGPGRNWWRRCLLRLRPVLPLAPVLLFLIVLFLLPVLDLLRLSMLDVTGRWTSSHYMRLFASTTYVKILGLTFRIAGWTTLVSLLLGYPVAYLLATTGRR